MIDQPRVGLGTLPFASKGDLGLDKRRVTQCALSRICGACARSLGRPVVFVGSAEEGARNAFHFPPMHRECADHALAHWAPTWSASLGHPSQPESWVVVTTSGFEFVRQNADVDDRRPVFAPNSVIAEERVPVG